MTTKDVVNRVLRWSELFKKNKYPPLGNEVAEGPKSSKNPELVKDAFFGDKYKYKLETDLPPPDQVVKPKEEVKGH